jgi:hypothetical protein
MINIKISKAHQKFSELLNKPKALTNLAKYLGPNWEDVLNFWIYVEGLSEQEKEEMRQRYRALDGNVRISAYFAVSVAAKEVVGWEFRDAAFYAAYDTAYDVAEWGVGGRATLELIAHHKLLEQNKTLTFLPLYVKP